MKMLEKSLQLYPLPGVEALVAHAKTKKNSPSNDSKTSNSSSNRETSNGGSSSHNATTTSNGTSTRRSSSTASAASSSSETQQQQQNGSDGRAYTQDQVLIVKKVLSAKKGGRGAHYRVLDITSTATESDIKKAYRKLSLKVHPDKVRNFCSGLVTSSF